MSKLIEHLKSFNRKERFILLQAACGQDAFQLSEEFRDELRTCLELDFEIPKCAYVAMDYHLDWLQVAMCFWNEDVPLEELQGMCRSDPLVKGTQEDVDLLVAFDWFQETCRASLVRRQTHVVLIEAKGDTPWDPKQLVSKGKRLERIFDSKDRPRHVVPHFVMMSPKPPPIEPTLPCWQKERWMELRLDERLLRVTRKCGEGQGKRRTYGSYIVKKVRTG